MSESFKFIRRSAKHWDIYSDTERLFRIRGGGDNSWDEIDFMIIGENGCSNATPNGWIMFKTLTSATGWITDYLMYEDDK